MNPNNEEFNQTSSRHESELAGTESTMYEEGGCMSTILKIFIIGCISWFLLFGMTIGDDKYRMNCNCDDGVKFSKQ